MGTPTQVCVRSCPNISAPAGRPFSIGWPAIESLGGGTGVRVGRGERGRRPREGKVRCCDLIWSRKWTKVMEIIGGVRGRFQWECRGGQWLGNRGMFVKIRKNGNVVNENVQENVRNVIVNGNLVGGSYKEFLACNPKEYDGKGGAIVLTRRIEKMKSVHDMSGCSVNQKVKYTASSFVGKALTWFCPSHEMQKLESELWNYAMVGASHAAYTDRFHELARLVPHFVTLESRMIERTRTRNAFATTINLVGRENTDTWPTCTTYNSYHAPGGPCRICFNCNHPGHLAMDCRGVPMNMNPVNARNLTVRACYEYGSTDHVRSACPRWNRAQGPGENCPNQVAVNNGGLKPSDLGFRDEIEIASGQLVEIDKGIKGYKLEIESHVFDIELIPFGHKSFDVIIGMDWLSNYKAEIICHEKVVRIPLSDGKVPLGVFRIELTPGATPVAKSPYRLTPFELEELSGQLKELLDKESFQKSSLLSPSGADNATNEPISKLKRLRIGKPLELLTRYRSFLGLAGYYRRFIENFSKIAKSLTILTQKCKTFDWDEEQELAFQTLKDKLCNAPVLALPDGPEDFVVYCDVSGRPWIELFSDYDSEIRYHPRKVNVVADALSRKEKVKPKRVRAMNVTLQLSIKDRILAAQKEAVDEFAGLQKGLDEMIE
ncbi:reverse transcriptase domain-containing protein [Tanacetum coccineum]